MQLIDMTTAMSDIMFGKDTLSLRDGTFTQSPTEHESNLSFLMPIDSQLVSKTV